jgi:sugar-phosphatase
VIGVLGTHSAEELAEADWVVPSLEELKVTVIREELELRFLPVEGCQL